MDSTQHRPKDSVEDPPVYEAAPPPYAAAGAAAGRAGAVRLHAAHSLVEPGIFVLDGQRIYTTSEPATTLYELNRGITHLNYTTPCVEFTRIEQLRGGAGADGVPTVRLRPRHIYSLYRAYQPFHASHSADCYMRSMAAPSRRLGDFGLRKPHAISSSAGHWIATPLVFKDGQREFAAGAAALWEAHYKQGACKWTDMAGNDVAIEYDSDRVHQPQLVVTATLEREYLDALVALWCCRIWELTLRQPLVEPVKTRSF